MSSDISIRLRRFRENDAEQLTKLINNQKIWNQVRNAMPSPYTLKDAKEYLNSDIHRAEPAITFAIEMDGVLAGNISVKPQNDIYEHSAETGYWIGEPFWGRGIATKAIKLAVKYGFEELKLARIFATVMDGNEASMKALLNAGFEKEGISKKGFLKNGIYLDEHRFGILNPDIFK